MESKPLSNSETFCFRLLHTVETLRVHREGLSYVLTYVSNKCCAVILKYGVMGWCDYCPIITHSPRW